MNDSRKRRPTLQDIADLTGVTKMTVSRYLRDPQAVAEATRSGKRSRWPPCSPIMWMP
ncbi:putative transcriptional regulator [Aeromonas sp. BIGb0405]|nr:putative transcriptional regulator [Aeromonas sp. BIGb0405]